MADGGVGGGRDGMASADKKKCNAASVLIKRMARLRIRIGGARRRQQRGGGGGGGSGSNGDRPHVPRK